MSNQPTLVSLLQGRSREDVAAFVAALYAARGAETRVDGSVAVVDGERYAVAPSGRVARLRERLVPVVSGPVDRVVVEPDRARLLADRYDAPPVTPTDLDRLARYGLDRAVADDVYRTHLGRPIAAVVPATPEPVPTPAAAREPIESASGATGAFGNGATAVIVGLLAVAVVLALVASPALVPWTPEPTGATTPSPSSATAGEPETTPSTTVTASNADIARDDGVDTVDRLGRSLGPGLTTGGVADPEATAAAHARVLENRSYEWELIYVETRQGNVTTRSRETVLVASPTEYVSDVTHSGVVTSASPVAPTPLYANGTAEFRPGPDGDGVVVEPLPAGDGAGGRQGQRAERYLGVLLDGERSTIVRSIYGDARAEVYVVRIEGADTDTIRGYQATAHVRTDGFVRYLAASYCVVRPDGDASTDSCVHLSLQYFDLGPKPVERPPWVTTSEPAENESTAARDGTTNDGIGLSTSERS